jgi:hypothetical protein
VNKNPDFVKLAEAMNVKALRLTDPSELPAKMKEFLEYDNTKPIVMECLIEQNEHVFPMVRSLFFLTRTINLQVPLHRYPLAKHLMRASYIQFSARNRKKMRRYQPPRVGDLVHKSNPSPIHLYALAYTCRILCIPISIQNLTALVRWFLAYFFLYQHTGRYGFSMPRLPLFQSLFLCMVAFYAWVGRAEAESQN